MLHRAQDGISSKLGDAYGWFEHQSNQFKIPETPGLTSLVSFVHRMFDIVHTLQMVTGMFCAAITPCVAGQG